MNLVFVINDAVCMNDFAVEKNFIAYRQPFIEDHRTGTYATFFNAGFDR